MKYDWLTDSSGSKNDEAEPAEAYASLAK